MSLKVLRGGAGGRTDVDRILPVLQDLCDDENVDIRPVLPVLVLKKIKHKRGLRRVPEGSVREHRGKNITY